jgi:hypothetical protein
MHEDWDEFCDITIEGNRCIDGEFTLKDGRKFASYGTAYGDGTYTDGECRQYSVDAGLIGCILLSDLDLTHPDNFTRCGQILTFPQDFQTSECNGTITFGYVDIETGGSED